LTIAFAEAVARAIGVSAPIVEHEIAVAIAVLAARVAPPILVAFAAAAIVGSPAVVIILKITVSHLRPPS
jgi:hypothetical protein